MPKLNSLFAKLEQFKQIVQREKKETHLRIALNLMNCPGVDSLPAGRLVSPWYYNKKTFD